MKILVNDVNFNAGKHLVDFAKKRAEKLYHMYDHIVGVEINMRLENNHETENKTSEIMVKVKGSELFAKKTMKSFEEATDASIEALKKQVSKYKETHS